MMYPKHKTFKSKKIKQLANGKLCTARITGVCSHNAETTVGAHLNGGGMSMKHHDIHIAFLCYNCHSFLDEHWAKSGWTKDQRNLCHLEAIIETQDILVQEGVFDNVK